MKQKLDAFSDKLIKHVFILLMIVVLLTGTSLIAFSRHFASDSLWHDLIRELGVATVVSFCVTIVIEYYSAQRREADIRNGVLDAIVGKIVHPAVWEEIRTNIIGDPVICEEWHLRVVFKKEKVVSSENNREQDQYIAHGTLRYKLHNLTDKKQSILLRHELETDITGKRKNGGTEMELPHFDSLTCESNVGQKTSYLGNDLKTKGYWKDSMLNVPVTLPRKGSVEVVLVREEILPFPGGFPWYMFWVTFNPEITVITDEPGFEFRMLPRHPHRDAFHAGVLGEWRFNGVMLPGQGFEIVSVATKPEVEENRDTTRRAAAGI